MKFPIAFIFHIALFSTFAAAQCPTEPVLDPGSVILKKVPYVQTDDLELALFLRASVSRGSWQKAGSEGSVVTIFVDGKYNQDVILFAGSEMFEYKLLIGRIAKGGHEISLVLNRARSARDVGKVNVRSATLRPHTNELTNPFEKIAIANSPIVYARPNAVDKFTDIPLIVYYEVMAESPEITKVRYSVIFTNEDGGTQSKALMARWGRMTDIEWIYEQTYRNYKLISETYQGSNHQTGVFLGKRFFGAHSLIYTVTDNNNFSDKGCSELRSSPLPIRADLQTRPRESVMDKNPWTYRIMAEEAYRENRVRPPGTEDNTIDDPRNYLYVDIFNEIDGTAVSLDANTSDGKVYWSDYQDKRLRVGRPGYQRLAVHFPAKRSELSSLRLHCYPLADSSSPKGCGRSRIIDFVSLDDKYMPIKTSTPSADSILGPTDKLIWKSN